MTARGALLPAALLCGLLVPLPAAVAETVLETVHPENSAFRVATLPATPDGVWRLSGPDAALFEIDGTGALRFAVQDRRRLLPDYEAPADADGDNLYELKASGGGAFDIRVRVADVDEPGRAVLPAHPPALGAPFTARLEDPDGPVGPVAWTWLRSTGRDAFAVIEGAEGATLVPGAAEAGRLLRAEARYADRHGTERTARSAASEAVRGPRLAGLSARTESAGRDREGSGLHPAFDPDVLHYAIACEARDILTLSFALPEGDVRVDVNGVQPRPGRTGGAAVVASETSDAVITLASPDGAATRYTVHCVPASLAGIRTAGAAPPGILFAIAPGSWVAVLDGRGVPRLHARAAPDGRSSGFFLKTFGTGAARRWAYAAPARAEAAPVPPPSSAATPAQAAALAVARGDNLVWRVLDGALRPLGAVAAAPPLATTGRHDFELFADGSMLLMTYEPAVRDLSFLSLGPPASAVAFDDGAGAPWGTAVATADSAIQWLNPDGSARWTWTSWGRVPLEDCVGHWFPNDYAHVNALQMTARGVLASFRGCSSVMLIDPHARPGEEIVWRVGQSNLAPGDFAARGLGPAPLRLAGDPEEAFCGQHAARLTASPEPRLLMYDNGAHCVADPATGAPLSRAGDDFSRAVEYALDLAHGEAAFVRDHTFDGRFDKLTEVGGHLAALANGGWLVSWGGPRTSEAGGDAAPWPDTMATVVDPATGAGRFALLRGGPDGGGGPRAVRALAVDAAALEAPPPPLAAVFPDTAPCAVHGDRVLVFAVAFSRPVADFAPDTPSIRVERGALVAAAPRTAFGAPAHSYRLSVAPDDGGPLTLRLLADVACEAGGICAADGTRLTHPPAPIILSSNDFQTERSPCTD